MAGKLDGGKKFMKRKERFIHFAKRTPFNCRRSLIGGKMGRQQKLILILILILIAYLFFRPVV